MTLVSDEKLSMARNMAGSLKSGINVCGVKPCSKAAAAGNNSRKMAGLAAYWGVEKLWTCG